MLKHRLKFFHYAFLNNLLQNFAEIFYTKHVLIKFVVFNIFNHLTLSNLALYHYFFHKTLSSPKNYQQFGPKKRH
jgi:hypothetical protein